MGGKIGWKLGWKNWLESYVKKGVEKLCGKILWKVVWKVVLKNLRGKVYSEKGTVCSVQYTVYSVQCTMYGKVMLLSLLGEPQCSSVWGVEPFAWLLLCLTPPEDFNEQLSGTSKRSEIWLSGTPKWSEIWLSGTPKWSEISIPKKIEMHFLGLFLNQNIFFYNFFSCLMWNLYMVLISKLMTPSL